MTKFLTPSEVPEEVVCRTIKVPNSLEWLGIFNAVLLAGTYYYNWSDDVPGHMTREEAAEAYTAIFSEYLVADMSCDVCTLPTGGAMVRQNGFGRFQMLDDGSWGEPTGDYALPPLNPRTEPTDDEKRCLGAANAANVYQQLYEALADEYAENHDLALFFLAIGVSISLLFLPPLGLLAASFLEIATILVAEGFGAFAFLTADVWDEDFTDVFTCLLYNNASVDGSGVVTFDFAQVVNDVANTMSFSFDDPTLQKARLALQLGTILQYTGADGLNYAASTTAITEYDCNACEEEWCIEVLFEDDGLAFLTVATGNFDGTQLLNSHNTGMGYFEGYFTGTLPVVDSVLYGIQFLIADYGMSGGWARLIALDGTNVYVDDAPIFGWHGAGGLSLDMNSAIAVTQMLVHDANPNTVGILGVRLQGRGQKPEFDDCSE